MRLGRRELGAIVACSLLGAGCLDVIRGGEFAARPATVDERVLDETDYDHYRTVEIEETHTIGTETASRDVDVVNVQTEYDRRIDLSPLGEARAAVFATLATPKVEVLGRTFNPVEGMANQEIANEIQSRYEEIDRRTVTVLEDGTEISKFEGRATFLGVSFGVFVHVDIAETDDDHVLALAIYPRPLGGEEETIVTLAEGIDAGER
jgi:hypothetical protein